MKGGFYLSSRHFARGNSTAMQLFLSFFLFTHNFLPNKTVHLNFTLSI